MRRVSLWAIWCRRIPSEIKKYTGYGWWNHDLAAAEKLMLKAGCTAQFRRQMAAAQRRPVLKVALLAEGDTRAVMGRGAAMVVENWLEFGIDATHDTRDNASRNAMTLIGDFDAEFGWTIETWGGHPDLFFFLQSWHSDLYSAERRERQRSQPHALEKPGAGPDHRGDPEDRLRRSEGHRVGHRVRQAGGTEMPITPIMSYNVFTCCDETILGRIPDRRRIPTPTPFRTGPIASTCS